METVYLIFSRSNLPASLAISAYTQCRWSHVGIYDVKTQTVIESTFTHHGVNETSINRFMSRAKDTKIIGVPVRSSRAVLAAARSQIGKPYDYTAIIGIVLQDRNWAEDDMWFCFELAAWALSKGGSPYFKPHEVRFITGRTLLARIAKESPYIKDWVNITDDHNVYV